MTATTTQTDRMMDRNLTKNFAYYNHGLPVEKNVNRSDIICENPFGTYQVSCDYENSGSGNFHGRIQEYALDSRNISNAPEFYQLSKETVSYTQRVGPSYTTRSFSTHSENQGTLKYGKIIDYHPRSIPNHKRSRTVFLPHQIRRLQHEFEREMYMVGMRRRNLSKELDLSEKQIKIWFQNRRMKQKRERSRKHQRKGFENFQNVGNYCDNFGFDPMEMQSEPSNMNNQQLLML